MSYRGNKICGQKNGQPQNMMPSLQLSAGECIKS